MKKIVLATNNIAKVNELSTMLGKSYEIISQKSLGVKEVMETGLSFVENALIKARNAAKYSEFPVIADDSGIVVDVLNGAPGIYSARYAGVSASDEENLKKLLLNLEKSKNRKANFCCAMVYIKDAKDPMPLIIQEKWHGEITNKPQGTNGFGYDSIFYLKEYGLTSAQLTAKQKNNISHRGKAIKKFLQEIKNI